jgi:hypothetical protein
MAWHETAPLTALGLGALVLLGLGVEAGYRAHRWLGRNRDGAAASGGQADHLLTAALGLLALLLGFTFSLALNRYEGRRDLVVQEANAIGTVALRAQLLAEPTCGTMADLLRQYVDARLAWSELDDSTASLTQTTALQARLWALTGTAIRTDPSPVVTRGLMEAMNASFDIASARAAARSAHVPAQVLGVLLLYAVLSMAMLGYHLAAGGRPHRIATALLLVLLTLALVVILDLDRPRSGAIQVSQQPLEALRSSLP